MRPEPAKPFDLLLASGSPRRRLLLESAGFRVTWTKPSAAESRRPDEPAAELVRRLARDKLASVIDAAAAGRGDAGARDGAAWPVVAADTVVVHGGEVLGKPADRGAAQAMLRALSGRTHAVLTGVAVGRAAQAPEVFVVETRVSFKRLRAAEIHWYLETGEWQDKAGGYGIQGRGAFLVRGVEGSYSNVVGLPLAETVDALARLGCGPGWLGGASVGTRHRKEEEWMQ